jgi:hypothetical protein
MLELLWSLYRPAAAIIKEFLKSFSFHFLGLDKVYFKNYFANELI